MSSSRSASALPGARVAYGLAPAGGRKVVVRGARVGGRVRYESVPDGDAAAQQRLRDEMGRTVACQAGCMPIRESLTLWLPTPLTSARKARRVLPALLDVQLPFPLEECQYRLVDLRVQSDRTIAGLAVVVRRADLEACLARHRALGLAPTALDHEGLALWSQSLHERPLTAGLTRVLLHFTSDSLAVVIGERDRFLGAHSLADSHVGAGAGDVVGRLSRILHAGLTAGGAIEWALAGDDRAVPGGAEAWLQPLRAEWGGATVRLAEPEGLLARGLARRALTEDVAPCNLLVGPLTPASVRVALARQATVAAGWMLAVGLALALAGGAMRWTAATRLAAARRDLGDQAALLLAGARPPYGQEILTVRRHVEAQAAALEPFARAFLPAAAVQLDTLFRTGHDHKLAFETVSWQPTNLAIIGVAPSANALGPWLSCLATTLNYTAQSPPGETESDGRVRFALKAQPQ